MRRGLTAVTAGWCDRSRSQAEPPKKMGATRRIGCHGMRTRAEPYYSSSRIPSDQKTNLGPQGLFCWHVRATPAGALAKVLENRRMMLAPTRLTRFDSPRLHPSLERAARARAKDALRSFSEGGHFLCLHNR